MLLTRTVSISNGTSVKIRGDGGEEAVIDGGGAVQLFQVKNGSALELLGLSLMGGNDSSLDEVNGGAVLVLSRSRLDVYNCSFSGNYADGSGGKT